MEEITLGLALEDYLPVIFSLIGIWFIVQMIGQVDSENGRLALVGLILVGIGGLSKATWKLVIATSGNNLAILDNSLFVFLAPGFACLSWALWACQQRLRGLDLPERVWLRPLFIFLPFALIALFLAGQGGRTWVFVLLGVTTLKNAIFLVNLSRQAWWQGQRTESIIFGVTLALSFVLSGLARMEQTVVLQWVEQGVNTVAQATFLYAAWRISILAVEGYHGGVLKTAV